MKTGFKDPISVKEGKKVKNPINFDQPPYDERTSCYMNAGTYYGVGHNQPVGKFEASGYAVPMGRVNTMKTDYVHRGNSTNIEIPEGE